MKGVLVETYIILGWDALVWGEGIGGCRSGRFSMRVSVKKTGFSMGDIV